MRMMDCIHEWLIRNILWRCDSKQVDRYLRGRAKVFLKDRRRPVIDAPINDWQLQTLGLCPAGGLVQVEVINDAIEIISYHPEFINSKIPIQIKLQIDISGEVFLYYDWVMLSTNIKGFGCVAFYRAAQVAQRLGISSVKLLAAGGAGYKYTWAEDSKFNGYHSWARFGFDADLWPETILKIKEHPLLSACTKLSQIIDIDPGWWRDNGDGCEMVFDLRKGSGSWHTLQAYLKERQL